MKTYEVKALEKFENICRKIKLGYEQQKNIKRINTRICFVLFNPCLNVKNIFFMVNQSMFLQFGWQYHRK